MNILNINEFPMSHSQSCTEATNKVVNETVILFLHIEICCCIELPAAQRQTTSLLFHCIGRCGMDARSGSSMGHDQSSSGAGN